MIAPPTDRLNNPHHKQHQSAQVCPCHYKLKKQRRFKTYKTSSSFCFFSALVFCLAINASRASHHFLSWSCWLRISRRILLCSVSFCATLFITNLNAAGHAVIVVGSGRRAVSRGGGRAWSGGDCECWCLCCCCCCRVRGAADGRPAASNVSSGVNCRGS